MISSSDRYMWLRFHSDDSIEYEGFEAVYSFGPRSETMRKYVLTSIRIQRILKQFECSFSSTSRVLHTSQWNQRVYNNASSDPHRGPGDRSARADGGAGLHLGGSRRRESPGLRTIFISKRLSRLIHQSNLNFNIMSLVSALPNNRFRCHSTISSWLIKMIAKAISLIFMETTQMYLHRKFLVQYAACNCFRFSPRNNLCVCERGFRGCSSVAMDTCLSFAA